MTILAGDPGVGKSVLSYSLALALASGTPFLGRPVEKRKVLYFDEENSEQDLRAYLHTLWLGMGQPDLATLNANLHIEHFGLAAAIRSPYDLMKHYAGEFGPDLIVLDTATPICRIMDENSNSEASQAIRQLRLVRGAASPHCTVLTLKHARRDDAGNKNIRGAKGWLGEFDGVLYHTLSPGRKPKTGWRSTRLESGKVRAHGLRHPIKIVPIGSDEAGWLLTAENAPEEEEWVVVK